MLAIDAPPSQITDRLIAAALDCFEAGILLLDQRGALVRANRVAEAILAEGDGWAMQPGRAPRPTRLAELQQFQQLIRQNGTAAPGAGMMTVSRRSGKPHYAVLVKPVAGEGSVVLIIGKNGATCRNQGPVADLLQRLHGFTSAQARLVAELSAGGNVEEAAASLGISIHTARTQLKQARAKTGLHNQMHLVRLAARYALFNFDSNGSPTR